VSRKAEKEGRERRGGEDHAGEVGEAGVFFHQGTVLAAEVSVLIHPGCDLAVRLVNVFYSMLASFIRPI
jgi:hypothetical protein